MTSARVAALALLYGVFAGAFMDALLAISGHAAGVNLLTFPVWTTVGFFIIYRLTFAYAWNCRVDRLVPVRAESYRK